MKTRFRESLGGLATAYYFYIFPVLMCLTCSWVFNTSTKAWEYIVSFVPIINWLIALGAIFLDKNNKYAGTGYIFCLLAIVPAIIGFIIDRAQQEAARAQAEEQMRMAERDRHEKQVRALSEQARQEREAEQERQRREVEAQKRDQQWRGAQLVKLASESLNRFESIPKAISSAEGLLDQAERDFKDGAYAPFWNSVEKAAVQLGQVDGSIRAIAENAEIYVTTRRGYEGTVLPFPIARNSLVGIAATNATTDRMRALVRRGQRDFQFATIFEHRRTNQLLVAGFTNLADALDGMGGRIEASIHTLAGRISDIGSRIEERLVNQHEDAMEVAWSGVSSIDATHSALEAHAKEMARRQDAALAMLDNIQQGRKRNH